MRPITYVLFSYFLVFVSSMAHQVYREESFSYEQRGEDLFLAIARVTSEEQAYTWMAIYDFMENRPNFKIKSESYWNARDEIGETLDEKMPNEDTVRKIHYGAGAAGQQTIAAVLASKDRPVDLWIAYAWSSTTAPTYPIKPSDIMNIEMIMTVTTADPFLYTWHMGITRNSILQDYSETPHHGGISVPLHCFAARAMKRHYPTLRYVRSNMALNMLVIMQKALRPYEGSRAFFREDGVFIKKENCGDKNASKVTLYDLPREDGQAPQVIWEGSGKEFDWPRYEGDGSIHTFLADINLLAGL